MSPKKSEPRSKGNKKSRGFSADERAAMKERARELKASAGGANGERDVLEKIAAMPEPDRAMAKAVHAIIRANAPGLSPRLWYGMPAYSDSDGKVACFFQGAHKFKTRYATLGFTDRSHLDDGAMWPVVFGLRQLTSAEESRIAALVKQAVS